MVVGIGQLSCQDAVKGTPFSAVAVDRTCMATVVHPCRVNLFKKPCPRLWTTQEHRDLIIEQLTLNFVLNLPLNLTSKLSLLQWLTLKIVNSVSALCIVLSSRKSREGNVWVVLCLCSI